jgi:hypothetical protein
VREVILGQLSARAYKVPKEKWELAEVAFQHLLIVLRATASSRDLQSAVAMDSNGTRAPGADVMLDMLQVSPLLLYCPHVYMYMCRP